MKIVDGSRPLRVSAEMSASVHQWTNDVFANDIHASTTTNFRSYCGGLNLYLRSDAMNEELMVDGFDVCPSAPLREISIADENVSFVQSILVDNPCLLRLSKKGHLT
jgi:hypothetical protein